MLEDLPNELEDETPVEAVTVPLAPVFGGAKVTDADIEAVIPTVFENDSELE